MPQLGISTGVAIHKLTRKESPWEGKKNIFKSCEMRNDDNRLFFNDKYARGWMTEGFEKDGIKEKITVSKSHMTNKLTIKFSLIWPAYCCWLFENFGE